jgi:hypothetical protein
MNAERIGVATRLFINGQQIGGDSTYMDYHQNIEEAVADTRVFYEGEGYAIESIEVQQLPRWPGTEAVLTLLVRLVSTNHGEKPQ